MPDSALPFLTSGHPISNQEVLFTRQRHEADKMGLHWDYRFVLGDKAYSWATKKEMPGPGEAILLFEQPVHDRKYALSPVVKIPPGNYGAGTTTLDWVHKASVDGYENEPGKLIVRTKDGKQRFLLKKLESGAYFEKYGNKAWLFRNLGVSEEGHSKPASLHATVKPMTTITKLPVGSLGPILGNNPLNIQDMSDRLTPLHNYDPTSFLASEGTPSRAGILTKVAETNPAFTPDLTPDQMARLGVLRHKGSQYGEGEDKDNFFGVSASQPSWPESWHNSEHPIGWYQWYQGYAKGKRTADDERQIKRWISFKARHLAQLRKADPTLSDLSVQPKRRQALLNWGIAPGINVEEEMQKRASWEENRFLTKLAKSVGTPSQEQGQEEPPHVQDALNKIDSHRGVITHFSTGAGKTRLFLKAIEREHARDPDAKALIVAPASLVTNVDKEIKKHGLKVDRKRLDVYSYEKATRIADELKKNKYAIAVADEAQKLRNANTQRTRELSEVMSNADKRLLATATANFNHSADIAPLVNIAHGSKILPENPKEFEQIFIGKEKLPRSVKDIILRKPAQEVDALKNKGVLKELFKRHVSYYDSAEDPEAAKHFPKVTETTHEVEMSPHQVRMYKFMENDLPFWIKMKIRYNLPMDKQEKAAMNSFSSGVRQVSNSTRHLVQSRDSEEHTPKIQRAVDSLVSKMGKDKNFRGLVYSNYLDAGTDEYSRKLSEHRIPHVVFTGKLTKDQKDQAVKDYNSGRVKVLIVSSSGSEGLDLKGTKLTQVLEPHFNPSKIKQVKGRGARFKSHEHLPEEERNMEVEHYLSVFPKSSFGTPYTSIDKYLSGMSDDKQVIFNQIKDVMRDANGKKKPE